MDTPTRNTLRNAVTGCRKILETAVSELLEGRFGIDRKGTITPRERMEHLSPEDQHFRNDLLAHLEHIQASGYSKKETTGQLVREVAFTHLNRLCAYKILETRGYIRESVSRGIRSNGFLRYCAEHPEDDRLYSSGEQDVAYRHYLGWLGATLNEEIGVLFSPTDPANRLFPPQRTIDAVMEELNAESLAEIWESDETVGWIYQYFTPKELRDKARKESQAPRNSYELAFRNQFFTPRYVVQFLTDNTLGRTWYEMYRGETVLAERCEYLVRYPDEVFLGEEGAALQAFANGDTTAFPSPWDLAWSGNRFDWSHDPRSGMWEDAVTALDAGSAVELASWKTQDIIKCLHAMGNATHFNDSWDEHGPATTALAAEVERRIRAGMDPEASQETLLRSPQLVPFRAKKDPREIRILDPACGSGHFLLYCYDLLETIYREAWEDEQAPAWPGSERTLREDYLDRDAFLAEIPGLILRHNLHGIDIDLRATQIASLALWLRAQRSFQDIGLDQEHRPPITKANIVCAEPMPGEGDMLSGFVQGLNPPLLGSLVREIFEKMRLAGEAGSLLKIEEDIRDTVADAKKQWLTRPKDEQTTLFAVEKKREWQTGLYSFKGITDASFWDMAEQKVLETLHAYARQTTNGAGYRRKLFAEDAERGFAFIELCQKEYDIVLMNPPFGAASIDSTEYIDNRYTDWRKNINCAFIIYALNKLNIDGFCGSVLDRTLVIKNSYEIFRKNKLILNHSLVGELDLGWNVLDGASVEVSSLILKNIKEHVKSKVYGIDVTGFDIKEKRLKQEVLNPTWKNLDRFLEAPYSAINFHYPDFLIKAFSNLNSIQNEFGSFYNGHTIKGDVFKRLIWEIDPKKIPTSIRRMWNGSSYSPFYVPMQNCVIWNAYSGGVINHRSTIIRNPDKNCMPGLCYGNRGDYLDVQILPESHILTTEGFGGPFDDAQSTWYLLGYLNSRPIQYSINYFCGQHKQVGYINILPIPPLNEEVSRDIAYKSKLIWHNLRLVYRNIETDPNFICFNTGISEYGKDTGINTIVNYFSNQNVIIKNYLSEIDSSVCSLLNLTRAEIEKMIDVTSSRPKAKLFHWISKEISSYEGKQYFTGSIVSYTLGTVFGRWDIRYATGEREPPELPDPFAPLPACSPGMLQGEDGLPLEPHEIPPDYPLTVDADGILVDDEGHPDDIIARIRDVLALIRGDRADAIEKEACEILGMKTLRDYFRKPGAGGFWNDHVKRYSKSRRKAPIYWLLQSAKKNYAIWIYYPRMDGDTLYKALRYAKDKLAMEERRLEDLQKEREQSGTGGAGVKKLEKEIDGQEAFISELNDFVEKLERAANLNLIPEHDDGVVLTIAPLRELVPWNEPKNYWDELIEGKYEWSSIGKQLAEKGLVKRS